jgi:hypothetical protein
MSDDQTSGRAFIDFWTEYAAKRGLMTRPTADTMKSSCKVVLETVEPEGWEELDITTIEVESFGQRFERLKVGRDLKPESLRVYKQRFRNGIATYLDYLNSPTTWKYPAAEGRSKSAAGGSPKKQVSTAKARTGRQTNDSATGTPSPEGSPEIETITYPYPLRPGVVITIALPTDLTRQEATRLSTFLASLAVEPQLALTSGSRPGDEPDRAIA